MATQSKEKNRTKEQARKWLADHGVAVAEFARLNGLRRHTVVDLLRGTSTGVRGSAHKAAVALGMKPEPVTPAPTRSSPRMKQGGTE